MANKNTVGTVYMVMEDVKGRRTIKIGFSTNIARRVHEYATHSTVFKFIGFTEGTYETESFFQKELENMGFERMTIGAEILVDDETKDITIESEFFQIPRKYSKKWIRENGFALFGK